MTGRMIKAAFACALVCAMSAAQADMQAGRAKARACAICHGEFGINLLPTVPNIAGQPEPYLAEQLKAYRSGKRQDAVMNVVCKPLTDAEIADLAAWYATIPVEAKLPE